LFVFVAVCLASVLYLAIQGYLTAARGQGISSAQAKREAETLLFVGIVAAGSILLVFAAVALKSFSVSRELDRLISLARAGSYSYEESLRRLGPLGDKIRLLQHHLQELSEKRSLRISTLSGILDFLMNNIDLALLVLDLNGRVEEASRSYLERNQAKAGELRGRHIGELDAEVSFPEVMARMEREHAPVGQPAKDGLVYYPVYNRMGQLANVIAVQGQAALQLVASGKAEARAGGYTRILNLIRRYTQRRQRT
jgi:PAS domain-containing protein